eukprot:TRINITY_DN5736_c0_g1_i2.p1 TRINITY_DN5736_c0_g1~~TRINITY_DN5736_c0_g1_i2.p1  ORF type:complete len:884 (-),score=220.26 TRINITY_DN5736_c0_g1_i2:149-2623(-)
MTRKLGKGAFATVKAALRVEPDGRQSVTEYAVKICKITSEFIKHGHRDRVIREAEAMRKLGNCPHVIGFYDFFEEQNCMFLVLELAPRGNLLEYASKRGAFSEKEAFKMVSQLVIGMENVHARGVVHRDIKLENLLLDKDFNVKIADFGLCNFFNPDASASIIMNPGDSEAESIMLHTICGSPTYTAPEMVKQQPYTPAVDVWSIGVILFALVAAAFPFDCDNQVQLAQMIVRHQPRPLPAHITPALRDLLQRMLEKDPKQRIKLTDIRQHPWFLTQGDPTPANLARIQPQTRIENEPKAREQKEREQKEREQKEREQKEREQRDRQVKEEERAAAERRQREEEAERKRRAATEEERRRVQAEEEARRERRDRQIKIEEEERQRQQQQQQLQQQQQQQQQQARAHTTTQESIPALRSQLEQLSASLKLLGETKADKKDLARTAEIQAEVKAVRDTERGLERQIADLRLSLEGMQKRVHGIEASEVASLSGRVDKLAHSVQSSTSSLSAELAETKNALRAALKANQDLAEHVRTVVGEQESIKIALRQAVAEAVEAARAASIAAQSAQAAESATHRGNPSSSAADASRISELTAQIHALSQTCAAQERRIAAFEANQSQVRSEIAALGQGASHQRSESSAEASAIARLEARQSETARSLKEIAGDVQGLRGEIKATTVHCERLATETSRTAETVASLSKWRQETHAPSTAVTAKAHEVDSENAGLSSSTATRILSDVTFLRSAVETEARRTAAVEEKENKLTSEIAALKDTTRALEDCMKQVYQLKSSNLRRKQEIDELRRRVESRAQTGQQRAQPAQSTSNFTP